MCLLWCFLVLPAALPKTFSLFFFLFLFLFCGGVTGLDTAFLSKIFLFISHSINSLPCCRELISFRKLPSPNGRKRSYCFSNSPLFCAAFCCVVGLDIMMSLVSINTQNVFWRAGNGKWDVKLQHYFRSVGILLAQAVPCFTRRPSLCSGPGPAGEEPGLVRGTAHSFPRCPDAGSGHTPRRWGWTHASPAAWQRGGTGISHGR